MTIFSSSPIASFVVAGLLAGTAFNANAADFRFSYSAHELETVSGRNAMFARLDARAGRYCGADVARGLFEIKAAAGCKSAVVSDVVSQIGDPRLEAYLKSSKQVAER